MRVTVPSMAGSSSSFEWVSRQGRYTVTCFATNLLHVGNIELEWRGGVYDGMQRRRILEDILKGVSRVEAGYHDRLQATLWN